MKRLVTHQRTATMGILLVAMVLGACRDIVYRDRELFEEPVQAAAGFVGYSNAEQQLTVCGQCHVSAQRRWQATAHADAWATLENHPARQAFCEGCHTVNSLGNPTEGQVGGWLAHENARYHDVQCESCHGPGLTHVRNPTRQNWPLAPLSVGLDLEQGCGECHSGAHHPFVQEWAASGHAMIRESPAGREGCKECHRGQDALNQWGVRAEYLERNATEHLPITCGVCHDPHGTIDAQGNQIPGQLRMRIDVASEEQNLCMQCHHKRGTPDVTTFRGPHSPEGPMLVGTAGWWPPNMELEGLDRIETTHGSQANPRLCAGCHVNKWTVNDPATGAHQFTSTGHTFEAIPCVDAQGIPTGEHDCQISQRSFKTCTEAGCHGSEGAARTVMISARQDLNQRAQRMRALEAQIPNNQFLNGGATTYTSAQGARFNRELAEYPGSEIHNPYLIRILLQASERQLYQDYPFLVPPAGQSYKELDEFLAKARAQR